MTPEPSHHPLFVERWRVMRTWWSLHVGCIGVALLLAIPALDEHFPDLVPTFLTWFPNHGKQWIPVAGAVIAMAARVISQGFVMERLRILFGRSDHEPH